MENPAEAASPRPEVAASDPPEAEGLAQALGIDGGVARNLLGIGLVTPDAVRAASDDELRGAGLSEEEIGRLRAGPPEPSEPEGPPPDDHRQIVEKWVRTVHHPDRPRRRPKIVPGPKSSADVLRRWVDGDDRALESWIQSTPPPAPGLPAEPAAPTGGTVPAAPVDEGAPAPTLPPNLVEREETVVRWLTDLLDRVKSERFDPSSLVGELKELQRGLYDERDRRRQLEEELEHVKRGSIAVIKYVRTRESKAREELAEEKDAEIAELKTQLEAVAARAGVAPGGAGPAAPEARAPEMEMRLRAEIAQLRESSAAAEGELKRRIVELEGELRGARLELESRAGGGPEAARDEREERERELTRRENELRTRFEEFRVRSDELDRRREAINFKDREQFDREQDLELRRKALDLEARRIEEAKKGLPAELLAAHPAAQAEAQRLGALEQAIARREQELLQREAFLSSRLNEVEALQKKAVEQEADRLRIDAVEETKATKIRTGVRRLDDLTFGGIPVGSQILVNGPAHSGKDLLARLFVLEGLKNGQGALWVITDRTYSTVREEMSALLPSYAEYEKRGVVRYVDLYSRSLGVTEAERGVKLLASNDKALLEQLTAAVNAFSNELKEKAQGYRLVFESVSTVTAYLDATATFRFLQPLIGRRKLDRAAGYYELETGMHSEADLQTLEHMMDGSINLKIDQLKTFLSLRGVCDVQSRAWVGYTFSKRAFNLGSFSLDHIR
jgi:KaiC/GvpD/RAD55 family RecA-like ATPase